MKKKKNINSFIRNIAYSVLFCAWMIAPIGCSTTDLPNSLPQNTIVEQTHVGTAKSLQNSADAEAKSWNPSAKLVQIQGVNIDSSGENDLPGALWTFTYISLKQPGKQFEVTFSRQGITQQETGISEALRIKTSDKDILVAYPHDSDDAIYRVINQTSIKINEIDRLNMLLTMTNGDPTWKIEFVDRMGQVSTSHIVTGKA